jgi:hypothetical protein
MGAWFPALGPTGLTLRNIARRYNHGVLTNMDPGTDWVRGDPRAGGYALNFDGGDDYGNLGGVSDFDLPGTGWSIHILVRRIGSHVNFRKMFGKGIFSPGYVFGAGGTTDELDFNSTGGGDISGISWPSPNDWSHWHLTNDSSGARVYLGGVVVASRSSLSTISVAQPLVLAADYEGSPNRHYSCEIAFFALWHRSLRTSEIQLVGRDLMALVRPRAMVLPGAADLLTVTEETFLNYSPFDNDESIGTAQATGGTEPYTWEILTQDLQ